MWRTWVFSSLSHDLFREFYGTTPRAFRCPLWCYLGKPAREELVRLGYRVDSSATPQRPPFLTSLPFEPGWSMSSRRPRYWSEGLLEIPTSSLLQPASIGTFSALRGGAGPFLRLLMFECQVFRDRVLALQFHAGDFCPHRETEREAPRPAASRGLDPATGGRSENSALPQRIRPAEDPGGDAGSGVEVAGVVSRVRHHVAGGDLCRPSPFTRGERLGRVVNHRLPRTAASTTHGRQNVRGGTRTSARRSCSGASVTSKVTPRRTASSSTSAAGAVTSPRAFAACGFHAVGIDIDLRTIEADRRPSRHFVAASMTHLPVAESCSDAVFAFSSFQYSDRTAILRRRHGCCAPAHRSWSSRT